MDSRKLGENVGFGVALTVFASILYFIFRNTCLLNTYTYPVYIWLILAIYLVYLLIRRLMR